MFRPQLTSLKNVKKIRLPYPDHLNTWKKKNISSAGENDITEGPKWCGKTTTAEEIAARIHHVLDEVSFDFSDEQRTILYESLFKIADRLEEIQKRIDEGETL